MDLEFEESARKKLHSGLLKMYRAVGSTLGPSGQTVLIESNQHTQGMRVTKDGVTVARAIVLIDPIENLAVRIMRQAADRTGTLAGDGTSTSVVLAYALINAGQRLIDDTCNKTLVLKELVLEASKTIKHLELGKRVVSDQMVDHIASISANNDTELGALIAKAYKDVGSTGIVKVEDSDDHNTYSKVTDGLKVDRGYAKESFVNDQEKDTWKAEDVMVIVSSTEINNIMVMEHVLSDVIKKKKKLLIIAPCTELVTMTLAANNKRGSLVCCVVPPPHFGYKSKELMGDIALALGATHFSEETGDDMSIVRYEDLGSAKSVTVSKTDTVIVRGDKTDQSAVDQRLSELNKALQRAKKQNDRDFILSRVASLSGGVGVIYAGGNTPMEQKELYDRIDDAVCAVRAAREEGIVEGGGLALAKIASTMTTTAEDSIVNILAKEILKEALVAPLNLILQNAGVTPIEAYPTGINNETLGFDVKNNRKGDMIEMGVIDPFKVTKLALENAVSVAVTILSTSAIITMARSYETS